MKNSRSRLKNKKRRSPVPRLFSCAKNLERGKPYRWKPGQSGNPGGRPAAAPLLQACRAKLEQLVPDDPHGRTYAVLIADMLGDKALQGNLAAAALLADRAEGRARQAVDIHDGNTDPLEELLTEFRIAHEDAKNKLQKQEEPQVQ